MAAKFIVWVWTKEDNRWMPNGDGPMGHKTAERVAREIREDFKIPVKVLAHGVQP